MEYLSQDMKGEMNDKSGNVLQNENYRPELLFVISRWMGVICSLITWKEEKTPFNY